jgi:hypothetical protein
MSVRWYALSEFNRPSLSWIWPEVESQQRGAVVLAKPPGFMSKKKNPRQGSAAWVQLRLSGKVVPVSPLQVFVFRQTGIRSNPENG